MKFSDRVYALCKKIPKGKISTYGELSRKLNTSPIAVGQALRCNPYAPKVPCHRVVKSDGSLGGFNGKTKGPEIKRKIMRLSKEGVRVKDGKIVLFEKKLKKF